MSKTKDVILKGRIILKEIPHNICTDYRAGSDGNIYSCKNHAGNIPIPVRWHKLKPHARKEYRGRPFYGYLNVGVSKNRKRATLAVHRLVCLAFHGKTPKKHYQIRHLDGDRFNNKPANLAWGTRQENWVDRRLHGNARDGEKHAFSKFSNKERGHIAWVVSKGIVSQKRLSEILGVRQTTIGRICAKNNTN